MRVLAMLSLATLLVVAGCNGNPWFDGGTQDELPSSEREVTSPPASQPAPQPAAAQADPPAPAGPVRTVVAYVNDRPIYRDDLYDLMVRGDGMQTVRHLVAVALVDQAAAEKGVSVSEVEIQAEHQQALDRMFPGVPEARQREEMLTQLSLRRGVSPEQWRMSMRQSALLTKLAGDEASVTEADLAEAFEDRYGRKVIVRHIQSSTLSEAEGALDRLREGAKFAELAREVSKSPSAARGGLLPAVGPRPKVLPKALHEVAWRMNTPGEVSNPIQVGTAYHLLYLKEVIAAKDVEFQSVKDELAGRARLAKLATAKQRIMRELLAGANVRYVDPVLKDKADELAEESLYP